MRFYEDGISIAGSAISRTYLVGGAAATIAVLLLSKKLFQSPTHKNDVAIPPGPPAMWFWQDPMPREQIAYKLTVLVEQYGPIVSLRHGGNVTIIIGRMDAATEIMEKEGGTLVDRPRLPAVELISGAARIIFEHAGERFRRLRRAAHISLQPNAARAYENIQAEAAKDVILGILSDPRRHMEHAQRYASTVILRVTYGKTTPTSTDDPEVVDILRLLDNFQELLRPGAYLVNRIPWLKYVPGYGRQLKEFLQDELALFRGQLDRVRNDMIANNAGPSFAKMLLENVDEHHLSDDEMAYLAGALFGAGSHTTASGIIVMIMAAACHPAAQVRVQQELDEVVGRDRVPTFEDCDMLPQLHAFMLEALRWRPVSPLGFAHRAMKDIIWRGQCIPSGATVLGCHWSISRDPVAFPDPETFNPRRWLTEDGCGLLDFDPHTEDANRVCPGQHVANRSLYINLALLLWSFRISQRPGAPINLGPGSFRDGIAFHPEPFEVDFVPRIEEPHLREVMA